MSSVRTVVETGAREYARTPVLIGLFVFLPVYAVGLFSYIAPPDQATVDIAGVTVTTTLSAIVATMMAPMSAALVAGIAGLFLMQSSRGADGRLVVAGYRPRDLVVGRLGLLLGVGVIVTGAAVGVLAVVEPPARLGPFLAATLLVALIYGAVGALVGVVLGRLAGVYLLLFVPLVDLFLFQNPLAAERPTAAILLPSHYPMRAAMSTGLAETTPVAAFGLSLVYLGMVAAVTIIAFYRATRVTS
ncbi:MAG: ABC transporter permease [Halobacteriaceae archaeon]